jgi:hypothetical protein
VHQLFGFTGALLAGFRLATPNNGCQLQLQTPTGTVLTTVNVPNTGGWQNWFTFAAMVKPPAGSQILKVVNSDTSMWNFN